MLLSYSAIIASPMKLSCLLLLAVVGCIIFSIGAVMADDDATLRLSCDSEPLPLLATESCEPILDLKVQGDEEHTVVMLAADRRQAWVQPPPASLCGSGLLEFNVTLEHILTCGNRNTSDIAVQNFRVVWQRDSRAPIIAGVVDAESTAECGVGGEIHHYEYNDAVRAMDECSNEVPVAVIRETRPGECAHNYDALTIWSATDDCGNGANVTHTVHVRDTQPPEILFGGAVVGRENDDIHVTMECQPGIGFSPLPLLPSRTLARDVCDPNANHVEFAEQTIPSGRCTTEYQVQRQWVATDACGNEKRVTHTFHMQDSGAPELGTDIDVCVWPPSSTKVSIITGMADVLTRLIRPDPCDGDFGYALLPNGYCHYNQIPNESRRPPCFVDGQTIHVMPLVSGDGDDVTVYLIDYVLIDQCGNERPGQFELIVPHVASSEATLRCTATNNRAHLTINTQLHGDNSGSHQAMKTASSIQWEKIPIERIEQYATLYGLSPHNSLAATRPRWQSDDRITKTLSVDDPTALISYLRYLQEEGGSDAGFSSSSSMTRSSSSSTSHVAVMGWYIVVAILSFLLLQ